MPNPTPQEQPQPIAPPVPVVGEDLIFVDIPTYPQLKVEKLYNNNNNRYFSSYTQSDESYHYPATVYWEDYDISMIVPSGTKVVEVSIYNDTGATRSCLAREKGGLDLSALFPLMDKGLIVQTCPVNSDRIIEIKASNTGVGFKICGYFT